MIVQPEGLTEGGNGLMAVGHDNATHGNKHMTKQEFLNTVRALYIVGNLSDSDSERREDWTHHTMAAEGCCQPLDAMLRNMMRNGVLSAEEHQQFYDDM